MNIKIGIGYDIHRLVEGRKLIIGGVDIPHSKGLLGHSDADVLIHSINDAILGACGLGDIGFHFPNTDMKYKDISSLILMEKVVQLMKDSKYKIINCDNILIIEKPQIAPYVNLMKEKLCKVLEIKKENLNIKATTNEKLGFCGREEGIAAQSIVLLEGF